MTDHFRPECAGGGDVFLLTDHPLVRGAVREAVSPHTRVVDSPDWASILEAMHHASPRALVVADPFRESRSGRSPEEPAVDFGLRRLLGEMPSTRVIAVVDSDRVGAEGLLELDRLGIADLLDVRCETTPAAVRARLEGVPPDAFRSLLDGSDLRDLPGRARLLLERSAEVAARGEFPRDLALRLRMGPRTLRRWTKASGLPSPRDLFRWLRVLLAASLLDDPGRRIEDVARVAGYSRGAGLRRAMRAVVDLPPSRLREDGAYRLARSAFLNEVREVRRAASS